MKLRTILATATLMFSALIALASFFILTTTDIQVLSANDFQRVVMAAGIGVSMLQFFIVSMVVAFALMEGWGNDL